MYVLRASWRIFYFLPNTEIILNFYFYFSSNRWLSLSLCLCLTPSLFHSASVSLSLSLSFTLLLSLSRFLPHFLLLFSKLLETVADASLLIADLPGKLSHTFIDVISCQSNLKSTITIIKWVTLVRSCLNRRNVLFLWNVHLMIKLMFRLKNQCIFVLRIHDYIIIFCIFKNADKRESFTSITINSIFNFFLFYFHFYFFSFLEPFLFISYLFPVFFFVSFPTAISICFY